jgi:hypothetical protein
MEKNPLCVKKHLKPFELPNSFRENAFSVDPSVRGDGDEMRGPLSTIASSQTSRK